MIDHLRARARIKEDSDMATIETAAADEILPSSPFPEVTVLASDRQEAIRLRYGEDLSFDEIAKRLSTSSENARQLVSRAIRQLKRAARSKEIKS